MEPKNTNWMLELIGVPYKQNGLTPEGFDCFGLVRWVYLEGLGFEIPAAMTAWRHYGIMIPYPCPIHQYDSLFMHGKVGDWIGHVGIAINQSDFIHAHSKCGGVVCEPIQRWKNQIRGVGRPRILL